MPWQANLWVGEQPTSVSHLKDILDNLGVNTSSVKWNNPKLSASDVNELEYDKNVIWPSVKIPTNIGTTKEVKPYFYHEREAGPSDWFVDIFNPAQNDDFWAIVGICLTGRYSPSYIDIDPTGQRKTGTPQPFPIDMILLVKILQAVQNGLNWPNAQLYMFQTWY